MAEETLDAGGDLLEMEEAAESTAQIEREEALARELEKQRSRKRALVDPLQFEMSIAPGGKVAEYQPDQNDFKALAPPSAKQLAFSTTRHPGRKREGARGERRAGASLPLQSAPED